MNPLLRAVFREKILRPLNRAELTCVFTALLVTSGIATFGLVSPLVPMVAGPWNPEWNTAQRGWREDVLPHLNRSLYLSVPPNATPAQRAEALEKVRQYRQGLRPKDAHGQVMARPAESAPLSAKAAYWWAVFQAVPWWTWIKPLSLWLIFLGACYGMFYCLAYVVLPLWVHREQLIFPLAQLPEQLLPDSDSRHWLPTTLRSAGFWLAFTCVFFILSWNGAVHANWLPGLGPVSIGLTGEQVAQMLRGSVLEGTTGGRYGLQFSIIFTAIGVAFLLPTEISFSLWFYYLIGNGMLLMLVWFGYGQTGEDFPSGIYWISNTVAAQGGARCSCLQASASCARSSIWYDSGEASPGCVKCNCACP